jgi:ABC-type transport system involved in multi-copper enzyme maturation permease subunit
VTTVEEVWLISGREIRKNLRSVKGLVIVAISILGGIATALLLMKLRQIDEGKISPEQLRELQEAALTKKYGDEAMGKYLADAPPVLLGMLLLTVWLVPLLIAIIGFDSISGELQHRSVRYWAVRSRRGAYYTAKVLGLWVVVSSITLLMHALVWGVTLQRGGIEPGVLLSWGFRFWLVTLPIIAAWCGLAQLVASQFRTPIIAFLVTCASFFVLWIMDAVGEVGEIKWLTRLYPNSYDAWLLSPKFDHAAYGILACTGFAVISTVLGAFLFARRDV